MNQEEKFERTMSDREIIKSLLKYLTPHKKQFIISFIYMAFSIAVDLLPPFLIGLIINVLGSQLEAEQKAMYILAIILAFVVIIIIGLFSSYKQTMTLQVIGQKIILDIRGEVFNHIQSLSIGQINEQPVGRLVTRVMNDADGISQMFTAVVVNLIRSFAY